MKLEGDIDELIFDYLEGNLDKGEQEAFNLLKEENETFAHNVRLWQNAYVSEALPPTTALEERCLVSGRPGTSVVTNVGFIALMVGVMLFVPSSIAELTMKTTPPDFVIEQAPEAELQPNTAIIEPAPVVTMKTIQEEQVVYQLQEPSPALSETAPARINELWIGVPVDLRPYVVKPIELSLPKYNRTTFSDREIERMKRHQIQRRRAAEFKAGKVPYVVPLSTKNF